MKKAILILLAILFAQAPALGQAGPKTYNVLLAGGSEANSIHIWVTADRRQYVIDSIVPLEVGGSVCVNPPDNPNELLCNARAVASFEVNAGAGDDRVVVSRKVQIPVTLRGGPGNDLLVGGGGDDKLIGGPGDDVLIGGPGDDALYGGLGNDTLRGGPGDDLLHGGPGRDRCHGGPGSDIAVSCEIRRRAAPRPASPSR